VQLHRLTHAARALAAAACILLALAASAGAMPADNGPPPSTTARTAAARPTVIRETVVRRDGGPGTLALVAIGVGAATALVAAGYIGARLATRNSTLRAG
jgi:hypothetical protein